MNYSLELHSDHDIDVARLSDEETSIISKTEELGYATYVIG